MNLDKIVPNLMVEDVRQTLNYYHGVLAFETINTVPDPNSENDLVRATVKKGNVEISFQAEDSLKAELPELRHDEPSGGFTLVIRMTGVDEYYQYLLQSADIVDQMKETFMGMKQFTIRDVDGYYLTFAEPIG